MKKVVIAFVLIGSLIGLTACQAEEKEGQEGQEKLSIVTSFYPMYDFTKEIVGDRAEVTVLIDGSVEAHDYEPSGRDIAKIEEADVFIYNSEEMETWVKTILPNIDPERTKVVEAARGIELIEAEESHDHGDEEVEEQGHHHSVDPHVWLDPVLVQSEVATILSALIEKDPANQASYEEEAARFSQELKTLDQKFATTFKDLKTREFVTQHTAFAYLAKRYDLEQVAITGISSEQEPTPSQLAKIEDYVQENKIKFIFSEDLASTKIAETIASATGAEILNISTLESLSSADQKAGFTYLDIMERNRQALEKALK